MASVNDWLLSRSKVEPLLPDKVRKGVKNQMICIRKGSQFFSLETNVSIYHV